MILLDALLAWLHFLCIFALVSTLISELVLYRREMDAARFALLRRMDMLFGIAAGLVIVSGILRVTLGLKGAGFYLHNPFFWTKMALFLTVGLLSILPTMHYLRLQGGGSGAVAVPDAAYRRTWALLILEVGLLACIPLLATLLAHGYD
jgi:putative membrane protein